MNVSERDRHALYDAARQEFGDAVADTLMELLPPVGWADVATKRDLDILQHRTEALIQREVSALRLDVAREIGTIRDEIVHQTRTIIVSTVGILAERGRAGVRTRPVRPLILTFPVSGGRYRGGMPPAPASPALDRFSAPVRAWFETSFAAPTAAQEQGWPAIAAGDHSLILAPTGSGQDPRRVPVGDRPARDHARTGQGRPVPRPLHLAAARARRRRGEEPPRADRGHRPRGGATRSRVADAERRDAHRGHAGQGPPSARTHAPRHPDHHARVAVSHAHLAARVSRCGRSNT